MLPPKPMLVTKNRVWHGAIFFLLAVFIAGCSPPGSRALLSGRKLLDRGDYAAAVGEFKTATSFMPTNAQAWNYYGVALQDNGQPDDAAAAYERALALDRDLVEVHYNLGCLWLEQNKPDAAKTEFIAYTLRRSNTPEGWLKLGSAQLRTGEIVSAEKSFSTALSLSPDNAEALNGLGLARIQRGRPEDAAKFFEAAIREHPDYAPAILNLAVVEQQYLHDDKSALQNYHAYLALTPHPADWSEVSALANSLEQPVASAAAPSPPEKKSETIAPAPPAVNEARTQNNFRPAVSPHAEPIVRHNSTPPPRTTAPPEVVKVSSEPVIITQSAPPSATEQPVESPPAPAPQKTGIWSKLNPAHWFHSSTPKEKYDENGVTPLPPLNPTAPANPTPLLPSVSHPFVETPPAAAPRPVHVVQLAPPTFPRYLYLSPRKPEAGNRGAASGYFTRAREMEQASRWLDAMEAYRQATKLDPSWFEAQYNFGVLSYRLHDYQQALTAYEMALAIQPDSVDARYNFALTLAAAGYAIDAANELEKILSTNPNEVRAQLALGNLYAQQFHEPARARPHYLKVLQLDPRNPQATDIRFWLAQNPP
ncbi:MAG TPA: tetratricopeptide repeat protein [Candidatus Aquilonibacter sp.]|nr:tetratricopeptide repeat protein [Candidatus Aquilonibacter sp.]